MMTKYQILIALYTYLARELSRDGDRSAEYRDYLASAEPLGTEEGTADTVIYDDFIRIADEVIEGDTCTLSEGWYFAGRYLYELSWSGTDMDEVLAVFSGCTEEEWEEIVLSLSGRRTGLFQCPCCGCYTLEEGGGRYEICEVCGWEDDPAQLRDPDLAGGANDVSLNEARENYLRIGACCEADIDNVRPPTEEELSGLTSDTD